MKASLYILLFIAFLLAACSSIHVKSSHNNKYDFSVYQTYRWFDAQLTADILVKNPYLKELITAEVDVNLAAKGFVRMMTDSSDLMVAIHAGIQDRIQTTGWGGNVGYHPWWGPYGSQVDTRYYEEGTLVIDILDQRKGELIWRGLATGALKSYDSNEEMTRAIQEYVNRILKKFPPDR
jgi:hypothetical protein